MNYKQELQSNNIDLQSILNTINNLPDAGGVDLPELADTGTAEELFSGKQLIDQDGNVVTGTFSIDSELSTQDELILLLQDAVNNLPVASGSEPILQNKIVTPTTSAQDITADSGYDGLGTVVVSAMPTATQATPGITVSASGLITASATQSAGYVVAGTKSATKQLTTQAAQTITPGTSDKTIAAGRYLTGVQTIKGDANLVPENIISGKSIFGVAGSASTSGSGGGTGGTLETVTITYSRLADPGVTLYYLDASMTLQSCILMKDTTFSVLKNSILIISGTMLSSFPSCTYIAGNSVCAAYHVTG